MAVVGAGAAGELPVNNYKQNKKIKIMHCACIHTK
jgi:hypothetical protein